MPNTDNKIKYGISKCYMAVCTLNENNEPTYQTPFHVPGARAISLSAQGEQSIFYADDIAYYVGNGNAGYQGDLTLARIPDEVRQKILGEYLDGNGVLVEDANAQAVHFALMFQFKGDQRDTLHVIYNCTAARGEIASQTKEDTVEPLEETLTITATSIHNSTLNKDIVKAATGKDVLDSAKTSWYSNVYQPIAATT